MFKKKTPTVLLPILLVLAIFSYLKFTLFIIPPVAPFSEGQTLLITRLDRTQFIDSPAAMCHRDEGNANLVCQVMMLGLVAKDAKVYVRLPYIRLLYKISTAGMPSEK